LPSVPQITRVSPGKQAPSGLQQPSGQVTALQGLHSPSKQSEPLGHSSQVRPPVPHAFWALPNRQLSSASQQPVQGSPPQNPDSGGASSPNTVTQTPARQRCTSSQRSHGLPSRPQASSVMPSRQLARSSQQPAQLGPHPPQEPLMQSRPSAQETQSTPPNPHAWGMKPSSQTEPLQQPEQVSGVQARSVQTWASQIDRGTSQTSQARPPEPQARCAVPGWQTSS
jgi:hypothetical protein